MHDAEARLRQQVDVRQRRGGVTRLAAGVDVRRRLHPEDVLAAVRSPSRAREVGRDPLRCAFCVLVRRRAAFLDDLADDVRLPRSVVDLGDDPRHVPDVEVTPDRDAPTSDGDCPRRDAVVVPPEPLIDSPADDVVGALPNVRVLLRVVGAVEVLFLAQHLGEPRVVLPVDLDDDAVRWALAGA